MYLVLKAVLKFIFYGRSTIQLCRGEYKHQWSKWRHTVVTGQHPSGSTLTYDVQMRNCTECNYEECRRKSVKE